MTPRELRDARLPAGLDLDPPVSWRSLIVGAALGVMASWAFFCLVLGWPK